MQGISEEKFQAHIAEMRQDAEWGTTMELLAIATMFKVLVFTFIGGRWASYRPFFSYENPDAPESKLKIFRQFFIYFSRIEVRFTRPEFENHLSG